MSELLELGHLAQQHPMAEMQVRRRGVEPRLDPQGPSRLEAGQQLLPGMTGDGTLQEQFQGFRWREVYHPSILA